MLVEAIERGRPGPGDEVAIALDPATSELWRDGTLRARAARAGRSRPTSSSPTGSTSSSRYPIVSLEDGMAEEDWDGWAALTGALGGEIQLVGDDIFVTNVGPARAGHRRGRRQRHPRQGQPDRHPHRDPRRRSPRPARAGYASVMSHRSGETEDTTIADLVVATGCGQIKTGAPARSDRVAKYNQLLRIEEELGESAAFPVAPPSLPRARRRDRRGAGGPRRRRPHRARHRGDGVPARPAAARPRRPGAGECPAEQPAGAKPAARSRSLGAP